MCTTTYYRSLECGHAWLMLRMPCSPWMNLTNCPMYQDRAMTHVSTLPQPNRRRIAPRYSCPCCDYRGHYNPRIVRVIRSERYGVKIGSGPSRRDPGCAFFCAVM
ncbi:uncharacterized protein K452DRAFT_296091 [Aplosporella prunicola CBS 121167]|uniref:Uncharacterized protein n=1 Tax=Aplosporella prunicola CBS 121167 TaxID=1176127 RepID=A0A6A6BN72_9PEZI|nr:uncharacterized protein K452DRAFT_296091 [Aplosporella prunicola CBS 121167]KAF2144684.1 hypothetical protein K452DRAFT_296091 [Aplosporella prunicola CBS 121167]